MSIEAINMSVTKDEIINAIKQKLKDANPQSWSIGITTNPRRRLFEELHVDELNGKWLFGYVENDRVAKEVKTTLVSIGIQSIDENSEGNTIFVFQSET